MLKRIWSNYSYTIVFIILAFIFALVMVNQMAEASQSNSYGVWVYQVTEINENEVYGENPEYKDFPNVFFYKSDVPKGEKIKPGDWVVTVFYHDDLIEVIKLNKKGGN